MGRPAAGLCAVGMVNTGQAPGRRPGATPTLFKVKIPWMLSLLANRNPQSFVPGINDLVYGNPKGGSMGVSEKMIRGQTCRSRVWPTTKRPAKQGTSRRRGALQEFDQSRDYLGYGYLVPPEEAVPPVALTFYASGLMVGLGVFFGSCSSSSTSSSPCEDTLAGKRWLLRIGVLISLFLGYMASEAGWVVAEVGRQPWAIQDCCRCGGPLQPGLTATVRRPFSCSDTLHRPADRRGRASCQADHHRTGRRNNHVRQP